MVAIVNLSAGGIFFYAIENLEIGTILDLKIGLSHDHTSIACVGKVVRTKRHLDTSVVSFAIQFTEIDEHVVEVINNEEIPNHDSQKPRMMSTILIVDDSQKTCTLLKSFLEETNHNVLVSSEEIDVLKKAMYLEKPDIIILDLIMDGIGGMEALKKKTFNKRFGIIMISGLANEAICAEALEKGADMYISKPVDYYHLTTNILPYLIKTKELD